MPVLRSRHFFWQLRLRKSEVPESTTALTKLGRLRLQAKKWRLSAPYTNIFNFELLKSEELMQIFFSVFWITFTVINCYQVMFCHNNNKAFLFCLPKRCSWSRDRLKKGGSGSRLRPTKKSAPTPP